MQFHIGGGNMKKALVLLLAVTLAAALLGDSGQASNHWKKTLGGIEVFEPVNITVTMYGTPGSTLNATMLENGTSVCESATGRERGAPQGQSGNMSFEWRMMVTDTGFVNQSYDIVLQFETSARGGGNYAIITFASEWWGSPGKMSLHYNHHGNLVSSRISYSSEQGDFEYRNEARGNVIIDTVPVDVVLTDLFDDLYDEYTNQMMANVNVPLSVCPGDPPGDEYTIDWESFFWDFGDGTTVNTTELRVAHTFTVQGTYTVVLVVTYEDGSTETASMEVVVT